MPKDIQCVGSLLAAKADVRQWMKDEDPGAQETGGEPVQQKGTVLSWGRDAPGKPCCHLSTLNLKASELCFMGICILSGSDVLFCSLIMGHVTFSGPLVASTLPQEPRVS